MICAGSTKATDLNAGFVVNEMNTDQRVSYIAGVIEGLAYARFLRDRPDEQSMNCVYDWFYRDDKVAELKMLRTWFQHHNDKPVGALLNVLIDEKCGE